MAFVVTAAALGGLPCLWMAWFHLRRRPSVRSFRDLLHLLAVAALTLCWADRGVGLAFAAAIVVASCIPPPRETLWVWGADAESLREASIAALQRMGRPAVVEASLSVTPPRWGGIATLALGDTLRPFVREFRAALEPEIARLRTEPRLGAALVLAAEAALSAVVVYVALIGRLRP
jgi:hypothetical protein